MLFRSVIATIVSGCNKEDLKAYSRNDNSQNNSAILPVVPPIAPQTPSGYGALRCFIDGETVTDADTFNSYSTVVPGGSAVYVYKSNFNFISVDWSIVSANPPGSITIGNTGLNIEIFSFASNFVSGRVKAVGTSAVGSACGPTIEIRK